MGVQLGFDHQTQDGRCQVTGLQPSRRPSTQHTSQVTGPEVGCYQRRGAVVMQHVLAMLPSCPPCLTLWRSTLPGIVSRTQVPPPARLSLICCSWSWWCPSCSSRRVRSDVTSWLKAAAS